MPLELDIVTPEKKIFSGAVDNIYLPGVDGEMGILPSHAGLVTALKPGELRYLHEGKVEMLAIGSGFAEVTGTKVIVLTDSALGEAEIDEEHVEAAIQRANVKLASIDHNLDAEEVAYLQGIIARSTAALLFKRKH
ncbi:MAG: ATP synthase F1 subunit epsilon [Akkermansiaceae bacterium]|jgi:F-type H+-transporting ATPase subunit epsilon|nr:ATP synthase F1 subunit epsilon [Akkermansiaceae bacterium]MBJ7285247.1 ATP synthase F1 subunit epsilon [Akkermansiaceae bacterium]MBJ7395728.1 ATP synthase F1 subunit epsilon [Akkermansiaceae bacterium]MBJ7424456.1 ATP synthase F1 subunit epsilon [Akkermansiaceae bacterium]